MEMQAQAAGAGGGAATGGGGGGDDAVDAVMRSDSVPWSHVPHAPAPALAPAAALAPAIDRDRESSSRRRQVFARQRMVVARAPSVHARGVAHHVHVREQENVRAAASSSSSSSASSSASYGPPKRGRPGRDHIDVDVGVGVDDDDDDDGMACSDSASDNDEDKTNNVRNVRNTARNARDDDDDDDDDDDGMTGTPTAKRSALDSALSFIEPTMNSVATSSSSSSSSSSAAPLAHLHHRLHVDPLPALEFVPPHAAAAATSIATPQSSLPLLDARSFLYSSSQHSSPSPSSLFASQPVHVRPHDTNADDSVDSSADSSNNADYAAPPHPLAMDEDDDENRALVPRAHLPPHSPSHPRPSASSSASSSSSSLTTSSPISASPVHTHYALRPRAHPAAVVPSRAASTAGASPPRVPPPSAAPSSSSPSPSASPPPPPPPPHRAASRSPSRAEPPARALPNAPAPADLPSWSTKDLPASLAAAYRFLGQYLPIVNGGQVKGGVVSVLSGALPAPSRDHTCACRAHQRAVLRQYADRLARDATAAAAAANAGDHHATRGDDDDGVACATPTTTTAMTRTSSNVPSSTPRTTTSSRSARRHDSAASFSASPTSRASVKSEQRHARTSSSLQSAQTPLDVVASIGTLALHDSKPRFPPRELDVDLQRNVLAAAPLTRLLDLAPIPLVPAAPPPYTLDQLHSVRAPRFNRMSGIMEWHNAVCLFVNLPSSPPYANEFAIVRGGVSRGGGAVGIHFRWFASPRQTVDTPIIARLIAHASEPAFVAPPRADDDGASDDEDEDDVAVSSWGAMSRTASSVSMSDASSTLSSDAAIAAAWPTAQGENVTVPSSTFLVKREADDVGGDVAGVPLEPGAQRPLKRSATEALGTDDDPAALFGDNLSRDRVRSLGMPLVDAKRQCKRDGSDDGHNANVNANDQDDGDGDDIAPRRSGRPARSLAAARGATAASPSSSLANEDVWPGCAVLLFCRLPAQPYIFCGSLSHVSHDATTVSPIPFVWRLNDATELLLSPAFRALLSVASAADADEAA